MNETTNNKTPDTFASAKRMAYTCHLGGAGPEEVKGYCLAALEAGKADPEDVIQGFASAMQDANMPEAAREIESLSAEWVK